MFLLHFICGSVFFISSFIVFRNLLRVYIITPQYDYEKGDRDAVATTVAVKVVSTVQAILACIVGIVTISTCREDMISDVSPVLLPYCNFGVPYMIYDIYAMFLIHKAERAHLEVAFPVFNSFIRKQWLMTLHHLAVAFIGYPIVVFLRNGKGDFFLGCLMLTELSTPFVSFRAIMKKLQWTPPTLFFLNDLFVLVMFFLCRILIFPYMYWAYGQFKHIQLLDVITSIPIKCNLGCLVILLVQCLWFRIILTAACKRLKSSSVPVQTAQEQLTVEVNCNHVHKIK